MSSGSMISDYAREQKWADEIMRPIVVSESIFLEARKHAFLGFYTAVDNAESKSAGSA